MKKINEEKGFTLTELLAVLVVLAIVAMIAYPIITKTINNSKKKAQIAQYKEVREQARKYAAMYIAGDDPDTCVTIDQIKAEGFLERGNIKDPMDGSFINGSFKITWNDDFNQFDYVYYIATTCTGTTKYTGDEFN